MVLPSHLVRHFITLPSDEDYKTPFLFLRCKSRMFPINNQMLDSLFILTYPHVVCKLCVNKKSTKCEQSHFVDFQSGKRDSDPRPQPWQGCALPTELFPQNVRSSFGDCVCKDRQKKRISKFGATEDPIFRHTWLYLGRGVLVKCRQRFIFACDLFASLTSSKILSFGNVQINLTLHSLIRIFAGA